MNYIIFSLILLNLSLNLLKHYHILQLNYYDNLTQLRWLGKNHKKLASQKLLLIWMVINLFWPNQLMQGILIGLLVLILLANLPLTQAKKPLKFTKRLLEMLALNIVIVGTIGWLAIDSLMIIVVIYIVAPLWPIIVNLLSLPLELFFKWRLVNSAKKILKSHDKLITIGITGSFGKTSMKHYLGAILPAKFSTLVTPESFNTPLGIATTIKQKLRATHEIFVCEMGASHKHDIKELCDIVEPTHGVITALGMQHLETFGSFDNIIQTKFELATAVKNKGLLLLNGDNQPITENLPKDQPYLTYGLKKTNDCHAFNLKLSNSGTIFSLSFKGKKYDNLQTRLIGEHSIVNLAGAIALSLELGLSIEQIKRQISKLTPPPHRLELKKFGNDLLIDDGYNSNPDGCEAALKTLSLFDGLKVVITPGMVELGPEQNRLNSEFGEKIARTCDFAILVGAKQTKPIYDGLIKRNYDPKKIFVVDSFKKALAKLPFLPRQPKVILIENDLPDNY